MIDRIDRFCLTVVSLSDTCEFYERVLDFRRVSSKGKPTALQFGKKKIKVYQADQTTSGSR